MGNSVDLAALRADVEWLLDECKAFVDDPMGYDLRRDDPDYCRRVHRAIASAEALQLCHREARADRERLQTVARAVVALERDVLAELSQDHADHPAYVTG
jgi:hypothetical protein